MPVLAAALLVALTAVAAAEEPPPDLPERIVLKSTTRTFTETQLFAVSGGKIWVRPSEASQAAEKRWKLLGGTGLPRHKDGTAFTPPAAPVMWIVADLRFLIAVDENRRVYDVQFEPHADVLADDAIDWQDKWGMPWRMMPELVHMPAHIRTADTSLLMNNYSEDVDGNTHPILLIHSFYVLEDNGQRFRFNDPWLPVNAFEMRFSSPERGRFVVRNFSSSGSTLLVVDDAGRLFTRLIDFDTMGGNPGIRYTYQRSRRLAEPDHPFVALQANLPWWFDTRSLPAEHWRPQARPPGRYTDRLAMVQTGRGNAARELRVEGTDADGRTGYWKKAIDDAAWTFEPTGLPLEGTFLDPAIPVAQGPRLDVDLDGLASFVDPSRHLDARVPAKALGFNLEYDDIVVEVAIRKGKALRLVLRLDATVYPVNGEADRWTTGALLVPDDSRATTDATSQAILRHFFPRDSPTPVDVQVTQDKVVVVANTRRTRQTGSFALQFERAPKP